VEKSAFNCNRYYFGDIKIPNLKSRDSILKRGVPKMEKCLGKMTSQVLWSYDQKKSSTDFYEVFSDPLNKRHTFCTALESSQEKYHLLKCLAHASLAEKVDPLFSSVMVQGPEYIPESVFEKQIWPVFCTSRTWFADGAIATQCSSFADEDARKKIGFIDNIFPEGKIGADLSGVLEVALALAESSKFSGIERKTSGKTAEMVASFLKVDPFDPDLENLNKLNNSLLRNISDFSCRLVFSDEFGSYIWEVF